MSSDHEINTICFIIGPQDTYTLGWFIKIKSDQIITAGGLLVAHKVKKQPQKNGVQLGRPTPAPATPLFFELFLQVKYLDLPI